MPFLFWSLNREKGKGKQVMPSLKIQRNNNSPAYTQRDMKQPLRAILTMGKYCQLNNFPTAQSNPLSKHDFTTDIKTVMKPAFPKCQGSCQPQENESSLSQFKESLQNGSREGASTGFLLSSPALDTTERFSQRQRRKSVDYN